MTNSIGMSYNIVGTFEFALGNPMSNYYYANYSLTNVGVANVTKNNEEVNLYPVPASTSMHIDVNWHVAQAATAVIYDMQGHVVAQWDTPNGTQFSTVISVNNLAAGNYVLKIIGTESTVVKQFAVSH